MKVGRPFTIMFFLADDTMEIRELHPYLLPLTRTSDQSPQPPGHAAKDKKISPLDHHGKRPFRYKKKSDTQASLAHRVPLRFRFYVKPSLWVSWPAGWGLLFRGMAKTRDCAAKAQMGLILKNLSKKSCVLGYH